MLVLPAVFLVYIVLALLVDSRALPRGPLLTRKPRAWLTWFVAVTLLYGFWFALCWRPILANNASLITLMLLVMVSNAKYRDVAEPLSILDFALLPHVLRHPALYRAEFLFRPMIWIVAAATLAVTLAWCIWVEPSYLPVSHSYAYAIGGIAVIAAILWWIIKGPLPSSLVEDVDRRLRPVVPSRHVSRIGLVASLLAGLVGWRHTASPSREWPLLVCSRRTPAPLVIAVQCESFVDLARSGVRDLVLPELRQARSQSFLHGRMIAPVQGAWTLRCEYSFLTGQPLSAFGVDGLHPYLRPRNPPKTLAHHLREAGFKTVFVHPFDLGFFNRRAAMPILGFDHLIGETDFSRASIDGFYVSDLAVADRLLEIAARDPEPLFGFAVTMENHNPWNSQRLPNLTDAADKYIYHLRNSDRMIGRLMQGLARLERPAVLVFYGDHVPSLASLANPFPDIATDYFVAAIRDRIWVRGQARDLYAYELAAAALEALSLVSERSNPAP